MDQRIEFGGLMGNNKRHENQYVERMERKERSLRFHVRITIAIRIMQAAALVAIAIALWRTR